jgi:hypothetical protein
MNHPNMLMTSMGSHYEFQDQGLLPPNKFDGMNNSNNPADNVNIMKPKKLEPGSCSKRPHNTQCIIDEGSSYCEVLNRPSKRVRFASIAQQEIGSSTSTNECSTESKWYNKNDFKTFVSASAVLARNSSGKEYYLAQLVHTYSSCCGTDDDGTKNPQSAALHLALSTIAAEKNNSNDQDCQRGMERLSAYQQIGLETALRRKSLIRSVLLAQCAMKATENKDSTFAAANTNDHQTELLQCISEQLSQPAKKFAAALGTVDAIVALMEYRSRGSHSAR